MSASAGVPGRLSPPPPAYHTRLRLAVLSCFWFQGRWDGRLTGPSPPRHQRDSTSGTGQLRLRGRRRPAPEVASGRGGAEDGGAVWATGWRGVVTTPKRRGERAWRRPGTPASWEAESPTPLKPSLLFLGPWVPHVPLNCMYFAFQ